MHDLINKIEKVMLDHLETVFKKAKVPVSAFDVGKGLSNTVAPPAIAVTTERIGFEWIVSYYELQPVISVYIVVKGVQPKARHDSAYPLTLAVAAALVREDFNLDIEPLEPAGPMTEVFTADGPALGFRLYKIDFKTAFKLDLSDDETLEKLLMTVNEYTYRGENLGKQEIALGGEAMSTGKILFTLDESDENKEGVDDTRESDG
ncbi:MAG: hypothetical protein FWC23_05370 [Chitinispirillia bacterium]|nr:hypothetical protein [Chitinispirillia bacterium]MCL2268599.1 hypothetical protein [Chitinispirillia bacterium]